MRTESFRRGLIPFSMIFVLVLSTTLLMTFTAPPVLAGGVENEPGGTTIEVGQGQEFTLRFKLYWDEPAWLGYFLLGFCWDSPRTDSTGTASENFTFVSASAYLEDNLDPISTNVSFTKGISPENSDMWRYTIVVDHSAGYPWDDNFYVDVVMRASGAGGVWHVPTDNHPIKIIGTIDVVESGFVSYTPPDPNITIQVLARVPAGGVDVFISPGYQSGLSGSVLNYTVTVKNTGEYEDNYDLTKSDNAGWGPTVSPTLLTVPAGESRTATLSVTVPAAAGCTEDKITVTATSRENTEVSDNASCIAHAVAEPSPPDDTTPPPTPDDTTPPPTPSLASPTNGASIPDNTPPLDWSDVSDSSGVTYDLSIASDAGFTSIVLQKTDLTASAYEFTSAEALADDTWYWRVRAVDGAGNISLWSEIWSFTVSVPPAPATLTADTTPIKASVYVDNVFWGIAPQTRSLVAGSYTVSFGGYLGYLTPPPQTVTLAAGETRILTVTYTEIPPELIENESPPVDIPSITTDENATIEVENTAITEMTIDVGENVENVRITVQQLTDKPAEIAIEAPGVIYCYLNIASENIIDADIGIVLINFRVEKAWITAENMDPDSIVVRRWEPKLSGMWDSVAEVWVSLPTARMGEDGTHHYYRAESPGLSIFGITGLILAPPEFELSNLVIDSEVRPGAAVTISVSVTNVGDLEGTYTVTLEIDKVVEATENVTLVGGATETVTFTVSRDVEGTYDIEVDGLAGAFVVTLHASLPIVPSLAITGGIALSAGILIIWLRRRRMGGNK